MIDSVLGEVRQTLREELLLHERVGKRGKRPQIFRPNYFRPLLSDTADKRNRAIIIMAVERRNNHLAKSDCFEPVVQG